MLDHIISGPKIYAESGVLPNSFLVIRNGIIHGITKKDTHAPKPTIRFPTSYHLLPGWIDLHVHGANQCDVMDGTIDALQTISQTLAQEGTTAFLATTMTESNEKITNTLTTVRQFMQSQTNVTEGAHLLGVHLEGPFISAKRAGAQNKDHIMMPDIKCLEEWQTLSDHAIKLVTFAPELPDSLEMIHYLTQQNIIASIGHSDATFADTIHAITEGVSYITHIFNAMSGIHQREPGVALAALLSENVVTELIVDGIHLHPAIVRLIYLLKRKEKMILITDAMRAKCLGTGTYDLGGQTVEVKDNKATLREGTLAGSLLTMPIAIQNLMRFTRCSLYDASKMAAENPAKILGVLNERGSIALGKKADLVVLDEKLQVVMTLCEGRMAYRKSI